MLYFIVGLVIGIFWRDIKWLTYDLLKAICKGIYSAYHVVCFGELKPGYSRWDAIRRLPKVIWYESRTYLKWEWLNGCKLEK